MTAGEGAVPPASCVFCKIARGDEPATVICEGTEWIALFPRNPATPGHTLVIPRRHFADLWDVDDTLVASLMQATTKIGRSITKALHPDGMNLISLAGRTAEQTVFHLHLHIVPRWEQDGFGKIWPAGRRYERTDLGDVADLIRAHC